MANSTTTTMLRIQMFLPQAWIMIYCLFLWCIVMCLGAPSLKILSTEKREIMAYFNNYGNLMDPSIVPKCENGVINLVEYSYHQMECLSELADDCTSVRNDELLPEEEVLLHEECSFRSVCTTLRFPTRLRTLENKINAMTIKFQCIGPNITILDMCEKRNLTFRNTLHLTLSDRTHFTECRCWVNQGTFTMLFNDIRLTQKAGSKCSPAELVIGDNHLSCNGNKKEGFGSVFKEKNQDVTSLGVYVSLSSKSEDISPDMVWLIFHPHEASKIECEGDSSSHTPDTTTATPNSVRNSLTPRSTITSSTHLYVEQPAQCGSLPSELLNDELKKDGPSDCSETKVDGTCHLSCPEYYDLKGTDTVTCIFNPATNIPEWDVPMVDGETFPWCEDKTVGDSTATTFLIFFVVLTIVVPVGFIVTLFLIYKLFRKFNQVNRRLCKGIDLPESVPEYSYRRVRHLSEHLEPVEELNTPSKSTPSKSLNRLSSSIEPLPVTIPVRESNMEGNTPSDLRNRLCQNLKIESENFQEEVGTSFKQVASKVEQPCVKTDNKNNQLPDEDSENTGKTGSQEQASHARGDIDTSIPRQESPFIATARNGSNIEFPNKGVPEQYASKDGTTDHETDNSIIHLQDSDSDCNHDTTMIQRSTDNNDIPNAALFDQHSIKDQTATPTVNSSQHTQEKDFDSDSDDVATAKSPESIKLLDEFNNLKSSARKKAVFSVQKKNA